MKKRIPMLLLLAAPYVGLFSLRFSFDDSIFPLWCAIHVIVRLGGAVYAFFLPRLGFRADQILFWDMLLKLGHVPVYVALFFLAFAMAHLLGPLVFLLSIPEYVLLLSTTMFGICGLWKACRGGEMSIRAAMIHTILHFFFCLDVFSAVIAYIQIRRTRKRQAQQAMQNAE